MYVFYKWKELFIFLVIYQYFKSRLNIIILNNI